MKKAISKKVEKLKGQLIDELHFELKDEVYNDFYSLLYKYIQILAKDTQHTAIISIKESKIYKEDEKIIFLLINKVMFENLYSFFELIHIKSFNSAVNTLRAYMELNRLAILFLQDEKFRYSYIANNNIDYRTTKDREFVQSAISKTLEKNYTEFIHKNKISLGLKINNNLYTKGSSFSELHSEISKICHFTNVNINLPLHLVHKKINMYFNDEINLKMQQHIKKYIEFLMYSLTDYSLWTTFNTSNLEMYFSTDEMMYMINRNIEISYDSGNSSSV